MKIDPDLPFDPALGREGLGDLYLPDRLSAASPIALAIHGGGWASMDKSSFSGVATFLAWTCSLAVFNINYRLAGTARYPACYEDVMTAAHFLSRRFPSRRLLPIGGSAGGHLALMAGLRLPRERVAGIVSLSGIADPETDAKTHPERYRSLFGREPDPGMLADLSPINHITPGAPPTLLTHERRDEVVGVEGAERFAEIMGRRANRCETFFFEHPGDGHRLWVPGSRPHRLLPDLERRLQEFIAALDMDGLAG